MNNFLDIENGIGIASVLKANRLSVPPNQREYSWSVEHVTDFIQDINNSLRSGAKSAYFLGTVVLTKDGEEHFEVADGQQRLATTTIILATIRDFFAERDDDLTVRSLESDFLFTVDFKKGVEISKLKLNLDDNAFFFHRILKKEDDFHEARSSSHRKIEEAHSYITSFFAKAKEEFGAGFTEYLLSWRSFLVNKARVLPLVAPDSMSAFSMFATMNDRGLRTSQVDLVKNFLFEQAADREREAHTHWSSMRNVIESISDSDDFLMEYMRWVCCLHYGPTKEKQIFQRIEEASRGEVNAIAFLSKLESMAENYSAIFNPEHKKWKRFPPEAKEAIKTLQTLGTKQMRPLILAASVLDIKEEKITRILKRLVSWTVRISVAGGSQAGRLPDFYADLAHRVFLKELNTYAKLFAAAESKLPNDKKFIAEFGELRIKVAKIARYYLRCLEEKAVGRPNSALIPNDNPKEVTLEHIMPKSASPNWPHITPQDLETHVYRLGNLALLPASVNTEIDHESFDVKAKYFVNGICPFTLTQMVADQFDEWGPKEIEIRQEALASYAPEVWPITP